MSNSSVNSLAKPLTTLVVGIGSPYGDDQAGWIIVQQLRNLHNSTHSTIRQAAAPANVLDWLDKVERLIICDACEGLGCIGAAHRWQWPTEDFPNNNWRGTHDLSLPVVLQLAQKLGRLPARVEIWGIEGAKRGVEESMSSEVSEAAAKLAMQIASELNTSS